MCLCMNYKILALFYNNTLVTPCIQTYIQNPLVIYQNY